MNTRLRTQFIRFSFAALFVFLFFTSNATIYYVSATGNDSNSGTNENLAWRTLNKVNSFTPSPGDQILFKRGDSWNGTITVKASGTSGSPIVYGAYGSGEKPKIYGSEEITGWTQHSGNIYKATFRKSINQLFIDNTKMQAARYPNSGYMDIGSVNSSTSFTCNTLDASINYVGAKWIGRTITWALYTKTVTASNSKTLTLNSAPAYDLGIGEGFYMTNKLEFLDQAGEWYSNSTTNTVYFLTPDGDSPINHTIRVSTIDNGFVINGKSHIVVENISILHHSNKAIAAENCSNLIINKNEIVHPLNYGIYVDKDVSGTYTNNLINGSNIAGIRGVSSSSSDFSGNEISDIGLFDQLGINGIGSNWGANAISVVGDNNKFQNNRIVNIGYNGISWRGTNAIIKNNFLKDICMTIDDGGAIYTYNPDYSKPGSAGSKISSNIIDGVIGNPNGYVIGRAEGVGIYMDERTHDVLVEHNTIARTSSGIFLHDNGNVEVANNKVFDSGSTIYITGTYGGNNVRNNTFLNKKSTKYSDGSSARIFLIKDTQSSTVKSDLNSFIDHHRSKQFYNLKDYTYHSFNNWKSLMNQDANSTIDLSPLATGELEELFYNDTKQSKTINLGNTIYRDIYGNNVTGSISLEPFTSKILIKTTSTNGNNQSPNIQGQIIDKQGDVLQNELIGHVVASDPDEGQLLNYSIIQGNEGGKFSIDPVTGGIYANTTIYGGENVSYSLVVMVADNAVEPLSASATITINITAIATNPTPDATAPTVSFEIPSTYSSLTVPITSFYATDNESITGYKLSENSDTPTKNDSGWGTVAPTDYTFPQSGVKTLYAWAKDGAGNISTVKAATVTITLPDLSSTYSEYLFEEASGDTVLDSKSSIDGTIINLATRTDGARGGGLAFSGSGYINLGQSFGDNVLDQVTLSAWVKPSPKGSFQGIIMHGGPNIDTYALYLNHSDKSIGFKTSGTSSEWNALNGVDALWDGGWHHIAVSYNGAEKIIYIDGTPLVSFASTGEIEPGSGYNLLIGAGRDYASPTLLYEGVIDEARIYNYGLSATEIADLYNQGDTGIPTVYTTEDIAICQGGSYQGWASAGQYQRVLQTTSGADSIVTTNLTVNPAYQISEDITINEGDNYLGWTKPGEYTRVLTSTTGCDSTIATNLTVVQSISTTEDISICEGSSYQGWTASGIYERILQASTGADSIVTTNLNVNPIYYTTEDITINEGDNYLGWAEPGEYTRVLTSSTGCDSTIATNLTVVQSISTTEGISICEGSSYQGWTTSGIYERVLQASSGADSIVTTNLTVNPVYQISEDITINEGESYQGWTQTGNYQRTLSSVNGCDSIVITNLIVTENIIYSAQSIQLKEGWNIFSSYLLPANSNMGEVIKTLRENGELIMVEDENGYTYENELKSTLWANAIGELEETEGYKIQVRSNCNLDIMGTPINLPLDIQLKKGWNIISFPYSGSVNAMDVLQPLIDDGVLIKVQDERGKAIEFWKRSGWRNRIRNFESGEGYKMQVSEDCILQIKSTYQKSGLYEEVEAPIEYFDVAYSGNGLNHMNINIEGFNEGNFQVGDELAAFDGDICVGAVKLTEDHIIDNNVSINASVANGDLTNGFIRGNPIKLRAKKLSTNKEIQLQPKLLDGKLLYEMQGSVFLEVTNQVTTGINEINSIDITMYPNPAHNNVTIRFSTLPNVGMRIILTDITGKLLQNREVQSNREEFNMQSYPNGMYFIKTVIGDKFKVNKLIKN